MLIQPLWNHRTCLAKAAIYFLPISHLVLEGVCVWTESSWGTRCWSGPVSEAACAMRVWACPGSSPCGWTQGKCPAGRQPNHSTPSWQTMFWFYLYQGHRSPCGIDVATNSSWFETHKCPLTTSRCWKLPNPLPSHYGCASEIAASLWRKLMSYGVLLFV